MRLTRDLPGVPQAAPVRMVHLGLGNFHRAHQAWYTAHAPDAADWGIAAFTGRRPDTAKALAPQGGLYTLVTRAADGDTFEVVGSLSAVHAADEHEQYLDYLSRPEVAVVTITVTEAAYALDDADTDRLRADPRAPVRSLPARLIAGLLARRTAGAGAISILSCDNLPGNGAVTRGLVRGLAGSLDRAHAAGTADDLAAWVDEHVDFATSMVDRITPVTTDDDRRLVTQTQGYNDAEPVPTEPFSEWVVAGTFPAGRPRWEDAGATIVDDVEPFEQRKLWLLNASHTLLAYAGSVRGHETIDDAVADPECRGWVEELWDEAAHHLPFSGKEIADYRAALLSRFSNPRVRDRLARIAADGSTKIGVRILPTLRSERAAGRVPYGCATAVAAWVLHLRGLGATVKDAGAGPAQEAATTGELTDAVPAVLEVLQTGLGADADLVEAVVKRAEVLTA